MREEEKESERKTRLRGRERERERERETQRETAENSDTERGIRLTRYTRDSLPPRRTLLATGLRLPPVALPSPPPTPLPPRRSQPPLPLLPGCRVPPAIDCVHACV
jgi:hypothetical protein